MISTFIRRPPAFFAPIAVGVIGFFLVIGPNVLDPTNIAWLSGGGDTTQHYLGWAFYRYGPWAIPLGLNPHFGLEIGSSIVFSDSIPLMAFLLKPFSLWLPEPFQYLGLWMLICFILQAFFAWLLIGLFSSDTVIKLLGTTLIVFAPPMLFRLVVHIPLASHFVVLAALYLALRNNQLRRIMWWSLLLCVSVLINFYLLAMVMLIWAGNLADQLLIRKDISLKSGLAEILIAMTALGFLFWQAGYLSLESSSASWGLGFYRMNLLSIFNPMGWSYLIDHLYKNIVAGEYEGFNYLGLGLIALFIWTIFKIRNYQQWFTSKTKSRPILFFCLIVLVLLSLSNQIGVGSLNFSLAVPEKWHTFLSTLRSSGRLFWPVWYLLVLTSIYIVIKSCSKRQTTVILSLALILQVADTSAKWWPRRTQLVAISGPVLTSSLNNTFWQHAAQHYSQVLRRTLPENPADWNILAQYAAAYRMATDSVYLARIDSRKVKLVNEEFMRALSQGKWSTQALYAIDNAMVLPVLAGLKSSSDLFVRIDGQNILAPGWQQCSTCPKVDQSLWIKNQISRYSTGQRITFNNSVPKNDLMLANGWWTWSDSWGTWSVGEKAQVNFLLPLSQAKQLTLYARALVSPEHPTQRVKIFVNDRFFQELDLMAAEHNAIVIPISAQIQKQGYIAVNFYFINPIQPKLLGMGDDDRLLAIGLESARFD